MTSNVLDIVCDTVALFSSVQNKRQTKIEQIFHLINYWNIYFICSIIWHRTGVPKSEREAMTETQTELEQHIESQYSSLSKRLQEVARYVLDNPNAIAFGTVASIAKAAGVHASTLVRFAHAFGFEGFSDMQQLFKDKLMVSSPDYESRIKSVQEEPATHDKKCGLSWLKQIVIANTHALENLCNSVDEQVLNDAISALHKANIIHIQGARRSFPTASYFSYLLNNIGRRAHLLDGAGHMDIAQLNLLGPDDVLFAISFAPYAQETLDAVNYAKSKGIAVIAMTDSSVSPLAEHADIYIKVKEAEIHSFRSLNVSTNIIQALMLGLIHQSH